MKRADFVEFLLGARRDKAATSFREANVFSGQHYRGAWEANPQRSVTEEQRSSRRKGPKDAALDL
jgi:hypothetical protein